MYVHKRGSSFQQTMTIPAEFPDGYFVGWTAASKIKTLQGMDEEGTMQPAVEVASLAVEWADPATTRELTLTGLDTSTWPLVLVELDVKFTRTADSFKLSTTTVQFTVVPEIT